MDFSGTKGFYRVDIGDQGAQLITEERMEFPELTYWPTIYDEIRGALKAEQDHFMDWVKNNDEPKVDEKDGLVSLKMALAILESFRKDEQIEISFDQDVR